MLNVHTCASYSGKLAHLRQPGKLALRGGSTHPQTLCGLLAEQHRITTRQTEDGTLLVLSDTSPMCSKCIRIASRLQGETT